MVDITSVASRKRLAPRREPYWRREGDAYLGYRAIEPDDGTWIGRLRENGKQQYQALGRYSDYRDAVTALRKWLVELSQRRTAGVAEIDKDAKVADACRKYLINFAKVKGEGRPLRYATNMLEAKVIGREAGKRKPAVEPAPIAGIKLADLTKYQVKAWRDSLLPCHEGKASREAKATATRYLKCLFAALNFAHKEGLALNDTAWNGVDAFGDVQARTTESHAYLSPSERRSLIVATDPRYRDFVELLACIGCRPIELLRAKVADYSHREQELALWDQKGRSGSMRIRRIPVATLPGALVVLERVLRDKLPTAPLFDFREGEYLAPFKVAVRLVGLADDTTAYSLRHSFISDAIAAGVPTATVASVTGTSIAQIERTYGKLLNEHAKIAFSRMGAA